MVRLEKIAYEKIVNSQVLGRSRALESPRKWFYVNPYVHNRSSFDLTKKWLITIGKTTS